MAKIKHVKTLQTTNVPIEVIAAADRQAHEDGLGSIQDAVRLFLKRYSQGKIKFSIDVWGELPPKVQAEYDREVEQTLKEIKEGKRKGYTDVDEMIKDLINEPD